MSNEQYPAQPGRTGSGSNCLKVAGISCLVVAVVVVALVLWGMNVMFKNPAFKQAYSGARSMAQCQIQMKEIGGALERYHQRHGKYPAKLADLYPTFLDRQQLLHCPADESPVQTVSYTEYTPPAPGAPGDAVVVQCKRHVLAKSQPPIILRLFKNGEVETVGYSKHGRPVTKP